MSEHAKILDLPSGGDFNEEVLNCPIPVIVDFHADWCGPCQKLGPILHDLFDSQKTFKVVKINVDDHELLSEQYASEGIPAVYLFKNGKVVSNFLGFDQNGLVAMVKSAK